MEVGRYETKHIVASALNPLDDVVCWVEGLTSTKYVQEILASKHSLPGPPTLRERAHIVAGLIQMACKYVEQAATGPKEVSFLPAYYAILNVAKAYVAMGPHVQELDANRRHGAGYDTSRNVGKLGDESIKLYPRGTIPLLYRTLVGQNMIQSGSELEVRMRNIYPYIQNVEAEYGMATPGTTRLMPFVMTLESKGTDCRIVAEYFGTDTSAFQRVKVATLQAFTGLKRDTGSNSRLVSQWHVETDTASLKSYLRPAMFYGQFWASRQPSELQFVPWSTGTPKLLLPEEIPLICAFFHMSSVVRYNPDGFRKLMDSKYRPVLLALRTHGLYSFLLLFWSFVKQCRTYIVPQV